MIWKYAEIAENESLSKLRQKGWANNNYIIQCPVQCAQSAARGTVQMWQMWLNKRANTVSIPNLHTRWNDNQSIAVYLPWKCYCAIVLSLQWRQFNLSNVLQCWSLAGAGPDYDPVYLQISTDRDNPIALTSAPASDMNFYNPRYSLHLTQCPEFSIISTRASYMKPIWGILEINMKQLWSKFP